MLTHIPGSHTSRLYRRVRSVGSISLVGKQTRARPSPLVAGSLHVPARYLQIQASGGIGRCPRSRQGHSHEPSGLDPSRGLGHPDVANAASPAVGAEHVTTVAVEVHGLFGKPVAVAARWEGAVDGDVTGPAVGS